MKFHIKKFIIKLSLDVLEIGSLFWLIWNKCEISDPLSDERPTFETLDFLYQQYSNFHAGNPSMCKERGFSF